MSESEKYSYYFKSHNAITDALSNEIPRMMELFKKQKNKVVFIRYEDLTQDPTYILNKLYRHINENGYDHDLNNIQQSTLFEHDHAYFRERTDHVVKPKLEYRDKPNRVLSERFHKEILKNYSWFYEGFYPDELE